MTNLLKEDDDKILLETGDGLLLEEQEETPLAVSSVTILFFR